MSAVVRWEDPPPPNRGKGDRHANDHDSIAAALRSKPGRWAVIPISGAVTGAVQHIKTGRVAAYRPAGSFEAVRRMVGGESRIYARFVGRRS